MMCFQVDARDIFDRILFLHKQTKVRNRTMYIALFGNIKTISLSSFLTKITLAQIYLFTIKERK